MIDVGGAVDDATLYRVEAGRRVQICQGVTVSRTGEKTFEIRNLGNPEERASFPASEMRGVIEVSSNLEPHFSILRGVRPSDDPAPLPKGTWWRGTFEEIV